MYVYILKSKSADAFYIGMTFDYVTRLDDHNKKKVKSTKGKVPWEIVHLEEFDTREEARRREKYLKSAAWKEIQKNHIGAIAQLARALHWQCRGRRFETG